MPLCKALLLSVLKGNAAYLKKIILWMKTINYPNTIRSYLVTIVPMAPFTPKSTSRLRSALHVRYSIVIPRMYFVMSKFDRSCKNTIWTGRFTTLQITNSVLNQLNYVVLSIYNESHKLILARGNELLI